MLRQIQGSGNQSVRWRRIGRLSQYIPTLYSMPCSHGLFYQACRSIQACSIRLSNIYNRRITLSYRSIHPRGSSCKASILSKSRPTTRLRAFDLTKAIFSMVIRFNEPSIAVIMRSWLEGGWPYSGVEVLGAGTLDTGAARILATGIRTMTG